MLRGDLDDGRIRVMSEDVKGEGISMASERHYDVIIVGSGAGGGTLAYTLAPTGKRILILERGDYVRREPQNWDTKAVVLEGRYNNAEKWQDRDGREFQAGTHYFV